jgi:tRNA_anti-like
MKKIILFLFVFGVLAAGIIYYMYNKPVASLENKKPQVEVTAAELIVAYEADEKAANDSYLGKLLQVSGKVVDITVEDGRKKIHLETPNPMSLIICELEAGVETGTLKPGDEVKVKGLCSGYLSDVILVQSSIVE